MVSFTGLMWGAYVKNRSTNSHFEPSASSCLLTYLILTTLAYESEVTAKKKYPLNLKFYNNRGCSKTGKLSKCAPPTDNKKESIIM